MVLLSGLCPHRSVPVEMDESMTSSSMDLAWPAPCRKCEEHTEPSKCACGGMSKASQQDDQWGPSERKPISTSVENFDTNFQTAGVWPHFFHGQAWSYQQDPMKSRNRLCSIHHKDRMVQESLEPPFPLMSEGPYPLSQLAGQSFTLHDLLTNRLFWSKKCYLFSSLHD